MSALDRDPITYQNDSIEGEEEEDNIDTANEISISQAVLEEAPLPDNTDRKISHKMVATPKDYPLSEQVRLEQGINSNASPDRNTTAGFTDRA